MGRVAPGERAQGLSEYSQRESRQLVMTGEAMTLSLAWRNMRKRSLWNWGWGVVVAALLLAGGSPREASSQAMNTAPVVQPGTNADATAPVTVAPEAALREQTEEANLAGAAVKPISTGKPLPPNLKPTGAAAEVIKLADAGVDERVIMAFVTNSTSRFNLGVEEILYLNDIGVPGSVVTAMMQRDQALKELSANAAPVPAAPASVAPAEQSASGPGAPMSYAPQPATAPAPPEMAPEAPPPGDYATESYPPPPAGDTGYSTYYDSLAPYGTWVDVGGYGPCWQPTVVVANPTWRPYCDAGRWVYTDCGWYWLSNYSWGWAPFHYGRWFQHDRLGWCWAPDTVWGPSWVCWRYGGSYCGWAPLPPGAWYWPGAGLTYRGHPVNGALGLGLGVKSFAFVEVSHFRDPHLNRHALPLQQAAQVYHATTASATIVGHNHRVINSGIPVGRVAAATRTQIHPIALGEGNVLLRPGARGERFVGNSGTMKAEHPAAAAKGTATMAAGSARTISTVRSVPAPRSAAPLILRGPDRPGQGVTGGSTGAARQTYPPNALVVIGSKEGNPQRTARQPSAWTSATPRSLPTAYSQDAGARPVANQRSQPVTTSRWATPVRSESPWAAPRSTEAPARSEHQRQYAAPSYQPQAPAEPRWSPPTPAPAPQPARSYSPPAESFTPRAPVVEARPSYSAPSAPAASAPASHTHSSSDRNGR